MTFSKEYLTDLVKGIPKGEIAPFTTGNLDTIEEYVRRIVEAMSRTLWKLKIIADFDHYGSGFASYVHLSISRKRNSDTRVKLKNELEAEFVEGVTLYLCRLAPYAVYSADNWTTTYRDGKATVDSFHFIEPHKADTLPNSDWEREMQSIEEILQVYGYTILHKDTLNQLLDFQITIPTVIGSHPHFKVFDCLFSGRTRTYTLSIILDSTIFQVLSCTKTRKCPR